jgi:hypothetical protein
MVIERDAWGADPSVRRMRRLFGRMELAQNRMLEQLKILPLDRRLRPVREAAKDVFEKTWALAGRRGLNLGENEVVEIYVHCLSRALGTAGVEVPEEVLTVDRRLSDLVEESLP